MEAAHLRDSTLPRSELEWFVTMARTPSTLEADGLQPDDRAATVRIPRALLGPLLPQPWDLQHPRPVSPLSEHETTGGKAKVDKMLARTSLQTGRRKIYSELPHHSQ